MDMSDAGALRPDLQDLRKDVAASLVWSFQALLAVSAFSAISTTSHSDWELLSQTAGRAEGDIKFPIIDLTVGLIGFFIVAPTILIAIQIYLQIQTRTLLSLPGGEEANGLIQNHVKWWPSSLLGFVSFLAAPLTIATILWKVWARHYTGEKPLFFGLIHTNPFTLVIAGLFVVSFVISLWGVVSEWRFLRSRAHEAGAATTSGFVSIGVLALAMIAIVAVLGVALSQRTLNLRRAPLKGADLRVFDLRYADLREAKLDGALMSSAMLDDALLAGAELDGADMRGAKLARADLVSARLDNADLSGACLVGAHLARAEIEGARFTYAWLLGAELTLLQPRSRQDRIAPPSKEDVAYEKAGEIQSADFTAARLCAAEIGVAHWSPAAAIGEPDSKFGPAMADKPDPTDQRFVPSAFKAEFVTGTAAATAEAKKVYLQGKFNECLARVTGSEDFGQNCPGVSPQSSR